MSKKQELVSLNQLKVGIREIWRREDNNFTPWLKEHIHSLGEALGLSLRSIAAEAVVGKFSLDLLAVADTKDGHIVVAIENQFGETDHDHLGKCLTYAGHYRADTIVWITETLRDEHRRAVAYFNENSGGKVKFYVVAVEGFRISKSKIAYQFSPYVGCGDWLRLHFEPTDARPEFARYHIRLEQQLKAADFPFHAFHQPRYNQINFYLDSEETLFCYHNFSADDDDTKIRMWVGMAAEPSGATSFNLQFRKKRRTMEKKLGYRFQLDPQGQDFWAPGIDFPTNSSGLESLIPQSVDLLQKFREVVFPAMLTAFSDNRD